jgi:excisionase family DNA binding protein
MSDEIGSVSSSTQPAPTAPLLPLLTCAQAVELLGIPVGTMYALVSQKRIPHVRFGPRFVRFSTAELRVWIRAQVVPAFKEAGRQANAHRP